MKEVILPQVRRVLEDTVRIRHALHQTPEVAGCERQTAETIAAELVSMGLDAETGLGGTGVAATIPARRDRPGGTVVLRAEMDALAVEETTGKPYASRRSGFAHCCGHDGHMAMVLGAGMVLTRLRDRLAGAVRLIFQPAEETGTGAKAMIDAGALGPVAPSAILAVHGWPGVATGKIACQRGAITAACDAFRVTIRGGGGHGARPEMARNPISVAARIVQAVDALTRPGGGDAPRRVASVGAIHAGTVHNVIPESAGVEGTIRAVDPVTQERARAELARAVESAAREAGTEAEIEFHGHCPVVRNDPHLFSLFTEVADELLGEDDRTVVAEQSLGAEDFGYYLASAPGLLIRVGTGERSPQLHHPSYDFDDAAMPSGIAVLAGLALRAAAGAKMG